MNAKTIYNLPVVITKQGRRFVAYSPALDISTSATTEKKVKLLFSELVAIFFEELVRKGTIHTVLTELGWKKEQKKWSPPKVISSSSFGIKVSAFV